MIVKLVRSLGVIALAAACPAHAQDFTVPPFQGAYQPQGVDERGLWMEADEAERQIRDSHLLIRNPALNNYVKSVLCRAVGEDRCNSVRLYIVRVPHFNASMAPNGMMTVWSGLLLRSRDESELASVLAHEFAHFERRHSLRGYQRRRTAGDILAWSALASAIVGRTSNISLFTVGAYFEFHRNQEREADILGLGYLKQSRYRTQGAAEIWARLMDEVDASARGRAQRNVRYERTAFFATHPTTAERAAYLRGLAGPEDATRGRNAEAYAEAMQPWINQFLDDQSS